MSAPVGDPDDIDAAKFFHVLFGILLAVTLLVSTYAAWRFVASFDKWVTTRGWLSLAKDDRPECPPPDVGDAPTAVLLWKFVNFDPATLTLSSTVRYILPPSSLRIESDGTVWPTTDGRFPGEVGVVAGDRFAAGAATLPSMTDADGGVDSRGNWVSKPVEIRTSVDGTTNDMPFDIYRIQDAKLYLTLRTGEGPFLPQPMVVEFDCSVTENLGWHVRAESVTQERAEGSILPELSVVEVTFARYAGSRVVFFLIVLLSILIGSVAVRTSYRTQTNGANALLALFTALALIQVRPIVVPGVARVGTVTDAVFFAIVAMSATAFVVPRELKPAWIIGIRSALGRLVARWRGRTTST